MKDGLTLLLYELHIHTTLPRGRRWAHGVRLGTARALAISIIYYLAGKTKDHRSR